MTTHVCVDARKAAPLIWQRNGCSGNKFPAGVKLV